MVGHLFNNDFTLVDRIKEVAGVDTSTIFLGDQRVSTNVLDETGNRAIGTRLAQDVYDVVLIKGQEFTGLAYVVNQWYITRYQPLRDHQGQIVGILYVGAKQASFLRLVDTLRRQFLLIAAASVLLAILIAVPLAWSISRPLTDLARATRQVAEGNWSVRVPVYGHGELGLLAESFNIMVETLRDTRDQLVQKEKLASVGQLAAGVAHEINNPLAGILIYADLLLRDLGEQDPHRQNVEEIITQTLRCQKIVSRLLEFSRQSLGERALFDPNSIIQRCVDLVKRQALFHNVEIDLQLDPHLPQIIGDPGQLNQVFTNLLLNAVDAMEGKGRITITSRPDGAGEGIILTFSDTGSGIPPSIKDKIFDPFFTTKPPGKGTGLGLAVVYGIIQRHGGSIEVVSPPKGGTTFIMRLPLDAPISGSKAIISDAEEDQDLSL